MTAIELTTCWAPVPIRWRYAQPGDVTVAADGVLLPILTLGLHPRAELGVVVTVPGYEEPIPVPDPDAMVSVLVPIPERDAQRLTVEQLGAVVIGRRTAGAA